MAEATVPRNSLDVHPKVAIAVFAGSVASVLVGIAKTKFGLDLSGYESDIIVMVMGLVGYITPEA